MKALKSLVLSGRETLPLIEGGKGISVSNGESSGAWAPALMPTTMTRQATSSRKSIKAKHGTNGMKSWLFTAFRAVSAKRKKRMSLQAVKVVFI